ncbi:MAG: hypothetical protein IPN20_22420 [Haliscomenobacter sp.]|nr:hypothetical protein [Haliscomenobacter sp.]
MKIDVFKLLAVFCVALLHIPVLAQGDLIWALHTPASRFLPGGNESGLALARDSAGSTVVAGFFSGRADFDPGKTGLSLVSAGGADAFIAKYAPDGALIWVKALGGLGRRSGNCLGGRSLRRYLCSWFLFFLGGF